ncbi:MAG: NAD(P)/FAD-dependent oxidoreductase, partial [Spongiibacter sp.]|nr:NAD(P)/FAD-dependent oxidoreductase [Spongiibacter sp.]
TGYHLDYPFIDRQLLNWESGGAPSLYLNIFHPQRRNLFVMGMIEAAGLGWEGRNEQAELVALYIRHQLDSSRGAEGLEQDIARFNGQRMDGGYNYLELERMAYYVHKDSYRKTINGYIKTLKQQLSAPSLAHAD